MRLTIANNNRFLVRLDRPQNEVQVYDCQANGNLKCLARIKPPTQGNASNQLEETKSQSKFTCIEVPTGSNQSVAYLGVNTGTVHLLDLTSCKITRSFQPFNNNFSSIVQIKALNQDATKLILVSKDKYVLFDMQSQSITHHFAKSKK